MSNDNLKDGQKIIQKFISFCSKFISLIVANKKNENFVLTDFMRISEINSDKYCTNFLIDHAVNRLIGYLFISIHSTSGDIAIL